LTFIRDFQPPHNANCHTSTTPVDLRHRSPSLPKDQ
jgi:hypothetical protein